jgi:hypothetical protein
MSSKISIPWELRDTLRNTPETIEIFATYDFWRGFLNAKTDKTITYRRFADRLTVAEISLSEKMTAHVFDNEKDVTVTVTYDNSFLLEFGGKWKYCTDDYSAYCGMKTGITDMKLSYDAHGFRSDCIKRLMEFVDLAKASDKLRLAPTIFL